MADTLPRDILETIFSRLPNNTKRVCNTWRRVIWNNAGLLFTIKRTTTSSFIRDYKIKLYYGDPRHENKVEKYYSQKTLTPLLLGRRQAMETDGVVGSCNGLVLYYIFSEYCLDFMCRNPRTGETAGILGLDTLGRAWVPPFGGFGYVGSTNEYKIVLISFDHHGTSQYVQVYTLGSRLGWRHKKGKVPHYRFLSSDFSGVSANGAVHWINSSEPQKCEILAFGLADEEFWPIPSPPYTNSFGKNFSIYSKLILLGGNLCVAHSNNQSINKRLDIWAFKKTDNGKVKGKQQEGYDDTWSWSKEYSITWEGEDEVMYTPFVITKRNTVLLWQNETSNLYCYDPKTSTLEKYCDGDHRDSVYVQAIPHMNSLVSLKEIGEIKLRRPDNQW